MRDLSKSIYEYKYKKYKKLYKLLGGGSELDVSVEIITNRSKHFKKKARDILFYRTGLTGNKFGCFYEDEREAKEHIKTVVSDKDTKAVVYTEAIDNGKVVYPSSATIEKAKYNWDNDKVWYIHEVCRNTSISRDKYSMNVVREIMTRADNYISNYSNIVYILVENLKLLGYYRKKYNYQIAKIILENGKIIKKNFEKFLSDKDFNYKYIQMAKRLD